MPHNICFNDLKVFATDVDGTLTDGGMYYDKNGEVLKRFDTRDAFGMNLLRTVGFTLVIVTGENSPIALARASKLGIKLVGIGVSDKIKYVDELLRKLGYKWSNLAYIGDDLNDLDVLEKAGYSACPSDACDDVIQIVDHVCQRKGGHGAVREFCDLILKEYDRDSKA